MAEKNLYIIGGCNGAGKTTVSFTILPELIDCKEFVNADEIARGISPFQPEKVAFEAGRIMIRRINELIESGETFAFETTLATRSYKMKIGDARKMGYDVTLLFFWLDSIELAKERVRTRVSEGGHNIKPDVIERRFKNGIRNLFDIYLPLVDNAMIFDNSNEMPLLVAKKDIKDQLNILDIPRFNLIKRQYDRG